MGSSGAGKSTVVSTLLRFAHLESGSIQLDGINIEDLKLASLRRHFAVVSQDIVLFDGSVAQNVALPLMLLGVPRAQQLQRVAEELTAVGLGELGERLPQQLSGGQLQRVALARALVHRPALILADEPTGNLDPDTAERVMQLLSAQTRQHGAACIMVTHSQAAAAHADRVLRLTSTGVRNEAHG